jgi:CDP-diacylglycerol--glycerol-3-phosphate 3-phosphatidyltransferase
MSNQSFVPSETRDRVRRIAVPIALALGRVGLTPNGITVVGFIGTCVAAIAAAGQAWLVAGILVLAFGIFDLFDGALARATGRASAFGAFLDSTLDRTGENLVLGGVAVGCAIAGFPLGVGLAVLAVAFASVVTYARAKADALGVHGEVGVAPRSERLVLLAAGLVVCGLTGGLGAGAVPALPAPLDGGNLALVVALGLIAGLSAVTVVQRILHVRGQLDRQNSSNQPAGDQTE